MVRITNVNKSGSVTKITGMIVTKIRMAAIRAGSVMGGSDSKSSGRWPRNKSHVFNNAAPMCIFDGFCGNAIPNACKADKLISMALRELFWAICA